MNRITNSFMILLMVIVMFTAGLGVLATRISGDVSTIDTYNNYINSARVRADKGITYYAKQDYLSAFAIYNKDQNLFREFLAFLEKTQDKSYRTYLKTYKSLYPTDVSAYERLCDIYYSEKSYKEVQTILLSAQAAGVTSDTLDSYKEKVEYEFSFLAGGYEDVSVFFTTQSIIERNGKKGLYYFGSGIVIDPVYDSISYCINGVSAVSDGDEYYFIDANGHKCGVLDKLVDSLSFLAFNFSAISIDGKYGYVDKELIVPEVLPYEYATPFSSGIAAVKLEGKWGIIDTSFQYIVDPVYDDIKLTEFDTCMASGVIFAKQGDYYVMLNAQGQELSQYKFEEVNTFTTSGQPAAVKMDGRWTFVKTTGELFELEQNVYEAKSFHNYLAPVTLDGENWGYMDGYGKIVIEPQFSDCRQFSEYGVAPVKLGETWSFIRLIKYQ